MDSLFLQQQWAVARILPAITECLLLVPWLAGVRGIRVSQPTTLKVCWCGSEARPWAVLVLEQGELVAFQWFLT